MILLRLIVGGVALLQLSLSSEPQEQDYFPQDTLVPTENKATTFSFPPQDLCGITLDEEDLVENYNSLLSTVEQIKNIEAFEDENDLMSIDKDVIYKQQPSTPNTCVPCNRPLKLYSQTSKLIYTKLKIYFGTFGGSATVKIKTKENKPVGEDDQPLLALGKFLPDNPSVVFSKEKLQYSANSQEIENCLCLRQKAPLSPALQRFAEQLQAQQRKLSE